MKTEDTTKDTMEKLENLYKEAEQRVTLIVGKINATGKILCWKSNVFFIDIGDYAIVENKNGYDLVEIIGKIETTKENVSKFSNTKYEDMKNILVTISKENF